MTEDPRNGALSRRRLLGSMAGLGLAALGSGRARAADAKRGTSTEVRSDGTYASVPLARDVFTLGVAQSRVIPVDTSRPRATRKANLDHMLGLIDASASGFLKPDLLLFHEFPITGWRDWTRDEVLRAAIAIPGEETNAIAAKARAHGMYIVFGSYARDPDWPGHALSITTIIDPGGKIIAKNWKARNVKGLFGSETELFTTTIYDVLDRFKEMYGEDAVVPVVRTPIGNILASSIQREPEYFRAAAMKGAELILRTATGGFSPVDIQATSLYNGVYTAICNNAISPGGPFFEDVNAGGSAIYGPDGEPLAKATSANETLVAARVPIAQFRARRRQPSVHKELFMKEFERYVPRYPPSLFETYRPADMKDAGRYLKDKGRWK